MRAILPIVVFMLLVATQGCYYDNEERLYPNSFCDTTAVTYATKVVPIMPRRLHLVHRREGESG
jgi:hypothetical protein